MQFTHTEVNLSDVCLPVFKPEKWTKLGMRVTHASCDSTASSSVNVIMDSGLT